MCWYLFLKNRSTKALNLAQNGNFSILSLFRPHFGYHSNDKFKIKARILLFSYSSNKPIERNWWKAIFSFWLKRGPKYPLNAHTPLAIRWDLIHIEYSSSEGSMHMQSLSRAFSNHARDFPRPDLDPYISPIQIQKWGKPPKMVYIFHSSTFWWKLHKNLNKNCKVTDAWKGSLTVWALYAYFSDSQNAAFELLVWCMQYQCNRWISWKEPASKLFSKFLRTRELWRVERGGGLKFHENKKCFKKWFLHVFLNNLVGMVISIEHTICRVLTNHDNWGNYFKNKICFVIKWFWGDNLEVTCTFLTTCTVNNTKLKVQQKK